MEDRQSTRAVGRKGTRRRPVALALLVISLIGLSAIGPNRAGATEVDADFAVEGEFVAGEPLVFTDASMGANWVYWNFGDATNSRVRNPTHTYTRAGSYRVTYTVCASRSACSSKNTTLTIEGPEEPVRVAADWQSADVGMVGEPVAFADRSTGPVAWVYWLFGDGRGSRDRSPVHVYSAPGSYRVRLVVCATPNECDRQHRTIVISERGADGDANGGTTESDEPETDPGTSVDPVDPAPGTLEPVDGLRVTPLDVRRVRLDWNHSGTDVDRFSIRVKTDTDEPFTFRYRYRGPEHRSMVIEDLFSSSQTFIFEVTVESAEVGDERRTSEPRTVTGGPVLLLRPTDPTDFQVEVIDRTSARVTWAHDGVNLGRFVITAYPTDFLSGPFAWAADASSRSRVLDRLEPGQSYRLFLRAEGPSLEGTARRSDSQPFALLTMPQ